MCEFCGDTVQPMTRRELITMIVVTADSQHRRRTDCSVLPGLSRADEAGVIIALIL